MTIIGSGHVGPLARGAVWALLFAAVAMRWAIAGNISMAAVFAVTAVGIVVLTLTLARRAHRFPPPASGPARLFAIAVDIGGLIVAGVLLARVLRLF